MASVQYLIEDVNSFRACLYNKTLLFQHLRKKRVIAAINIQRRWRGYWVRQHTARLTKAAVKIQTLYRGWIVRWNKDKYIAEYINARNYRLFNEMARRISVVWRGYWVRKNLPDDQNMIKRRIHREQMKNEGEKVVSCMLEDLNRLKYGVQSKGQMIKNEEQCKQWVLYILHKCHHLIRTKHIPGIYSNNHKGDYSYVEQLMKSLPMRDYMDNVRKEYYEMQNQKPPKTPYIYEERAIRWMEDTFKLRYKLDDVKSTSALNIIYEKIPFILSTRTSEKPYEKLLAYQHGPYSILKPLQRISEPELNVSKHDFVLSKKVVKKEPDIHPYYIDNWDKPKCNLHYPVNLYGDYK